MKHVHKTNSSQFILFILLTALFIINSQTYHVNGTLVTVNDVPIANHKVMLYNDQDEKIASDRTDSLGKFNLIYQVEPTSTAPGSGPDSPSEFKLSASFPNPFNPRTTVPFEAPENTHAEISVYNILGQEIMRTSTDVNKGRNEIVVNLGGNLSQGQYLLRVQGNGYSLTQSMTFISAGISGGTPGINVRQGGKAAKQNTASNISSSENDKQYRIVIKGNDIFQEEELFIPSVTDHETGIMTILFRKGISDIETAENTLIADDSTLEKISGVSEDGTTYSFSSRTAVLDSLVESDLLILGRSPITPLGALRRVEEVRTDDDTFELITSEATIEEAFETLEISFQEELRPDQVDSITYKVPSLGIRQKMTRKTHPEILDLAFSIPINQDFGDISVDGQLLMKPGFDFYMRVGQFRLREFRMVIENDITNELVVSSSVSQSIESEHIIFEYWLHPIAIGPIVLTPKITAKVGIQGEVKAGISSGVDISVTMEGGLHYNEGSWDQISNFTPSFEATIAETDVNASVKAYLGPQLDFFLYGVAGPFLGVQGYGEMSWDMFRNPFYQVHAGIGATAGVEMRILSFFTASYTVPDLFSYRRLIYEAGFHEDEDIEIATNEVTDITATSAKSGGVITHDGGSEITARGVCWSTAPEPDLSSNCTEDGSGKGEFVSQLSGLDPETTYYVRAYGINDDGAVFGNEESFITRSVSDMQLVYRETFQTDPGFDIIYSSNTEGKSNIFWDSDEENFFVSVRDQSSSWYSVGKSPVFDHVIDPKTMDFRINLRFNPIKPDWGHYPGIYFVKSDGTATPHDLKRALQFTINWSDRVFKRFTIRGYDGDDSELYRSATIPRENEWYNVIITYSSSEKKVSLIIERQDGSIFVEQNNLDIPITNVFDQLLIGEIQGPVKYGTEARIRIDDVYVEIE